MRVRHLKSNFCKFAMKIDITPELARICAELTGDGHIQIQDWRGLVSFYSKNLGTIKDFESRFKQIFNVSGRIYADNRRNWNRHKLFFISMPVAKALQALEVPVGNKTNQPFYVPKWVLNGAVEIKSAYLRGLYNAEGSINFTKSGNRWRIQIEMYKWTQYQNECRSFFGQLKSMLEEFEVRCSPVHFGSKNLRKDGTLSIAVRLTIERSSFGNFYKRVGFDDKMKAAKLARLCGGDGLSQPLPLRRFSAIAGL